MAKQNLPRDIQDWLKITAISILVFFFGLGMAMLITKSSPMQTHKDISRLRDRKSELLEEVVQSLLRESRVPPDLLNRLKELESSLQNNMEMRRQFEKEGRTHAEVRSLVKEHRATQTELRKHKRTILEAAFDHNRTGEALPEASEYMENKRQLQEMEAQPGFFYSGIGGIILILAGLFFGIVTWFGIGGIVFFGIVGGLNVLFSTKFQE